MPNDAIICNMHLLALGGEVMVKRLLLKTRIAVFFIILMLVQILLSSGFAVNRGIALTKDILGNQAYKAGYVAAQLVDGDKLKEVIETMDSNHQYYGELQENLNQARKTLGLEYLYTMTKDKAGRYIYLVDGLEPNSEDFSQLGEVEDFEEYFGNFDLALKGQVVKDDFAFNNEWGNLVSAYIPIRDSAGNVVAFLGADLDADTILALMNKNTIAMVAVTIAVTLLGIIGALLLSKHIASPITELRENSRKAATGAFASFANSGEIDEIGELASIIESRVEAVKAILNNTGQGLLTFGDDLLVDSEYSTECERIFGESIEGKNFLNLIHPEDEEQRKFIGAVLVKLLKEQNLNRREVYFPLLSEELNINNRSILVEYRIIRSKSSADQRFMVILTDVTEKRVLENKVESERDTFRMVVKIIANNEDFMDCTRDYENYFNDGVKSVIESDGRLVDKVYEIFRHVHTLKGSFSQLGMANTASKLHELEAGLTELSRDLKGHSPAELQELLNTFDYRYGMDKDISLLQEMLGEGFIDRFADMGRGIVIDRMKLLDIEKKMLSILSPIECKLLMPEIQKLRYKPFKELLKSYPDYMSSLAERLGKQIQDIEISGGEFEVDTERYADFAKSLTHVFRNAVDHGIESMEERAAAGKDELGKICCMVSMDEESIQLRISDDGYGINVEKVKRKAIEKGIISEKDMESISDAEVLNIIFTEGFSTKEEVNELSGRGIGLPAVLKEVLKLNGKISVSSTAGKGAEFCITLPASKTADLLQVTIKDIMTPLLNTVVDFIGKQLGEKEKVRVKMSMQRMDRAVLSKYTAFSDVKGILMGRFVLSFDEGLAESFAARFSLDALPEGKEAEYIEDSISECLNIILGNSIKRFQGLDELVIFTSPVTINSEGTAIKYPESDVWTGSIEFQSGGMTISFVSPRGLL